MGTWREISELARLRPARVGLLGFELFKAWADTSNLLSETIELASKRSFGLLVTSSGRLASYEDRL